MNKLKSKGFTLIELLIVIAIIAIIAAVVYVALDPMTRFQDARISTRWTDVSALLSAIKIHQIDNDGDLHSVIYGLTDDSYYMIGECGGGADGMGVCAAVAVEAVCADLENATTGLDGLGYLASIPIDPSGEPGTDMSGYYIQKTNPVGTNEIITIGACLEEGTDGAVSVSR